METTPFTLDDIGWAMNSLTQAAFVIACSRLRDGGGKSFSNKKCEKHAAIFPAAIAPFPKSCPSYFRFARFNTFALYYLRAWHRLLFLVGWSEKKSSRQKERDFLLWPVPTDWKPFSACRSKRFIVGRVAGVWKARKKGNAPDYMSPVPSFWNYYLSAIFPKRRKGTFKVTFKC